MLTHKTVDECIKAYINLCNEVFKVDNILLDSEGDPFDYKKLEATVKILIREKCDSNEDCPMDSIPSSGCRTFVVAKTEDDINALPTVFRTYSGKGLRSSSCALWEAARATTATPGFFEPIRIRNLSNGTAIAYVGGGLGSNNPSEIALKEARKIWPLYTNFGVVSIGTGQPSANTIPNMDETNHSFVTSVMSFIPMTVSARWKGEGNSKPGIQVITKMAKASAKLVADSEAVHGRVLLESNVANGGRGFPYFRFNVPRNIGDIGLADAPKFRQLTVHTHNYMIEEQIGQLRRRCVEYLISGVNASTLPRNTALITGIGGIQVPGLALHEGPRSS
jgi:hypothetical protein